MNADKLLAGICQLQETTHDYVQRVGADYRRQFHPDLSPPGWHLGHCVYTEEYWLHQAVPNKEPPEKELHQLYTTDYSLKPQRGEQLPALHALLRWARARQQKNLGLLGKVSGHRHTLLHKHYLLHFLLQHYAQHYETLCVINAQRRRPESKPCLAQVPRTHDSKPDMRLLPAGSYWIGTNHHACYDNERPRHQVWLSPVHISRRPVNNSEYLKFIEAGGYRQARYWSRSGWQWRCQASIEAPEHWRADGNGRWHAPRAGTKETDLGRQPVIGISYFEAEAYTRWSGGRLPHEYEWEGAARLGLIEQTGKVWEWCTNPLYPYPGFRACPYEGYSVPYFDGNHYVLRGGSDYTRPEIRRPSFRNYYVPETRYLYAGLRPAWPLQTSAAI